MTKKIVVAAFATMSLYIIGCRDSLASREGQLVSFSHEDAVEMVSMVMKSMIASQRFSRTDGRRTVIAVDALDTSSSVCDESVMSVARVFDMYLREELTNSGLFMIYDAENRSLANSNVLPQCRFKGKLIRSVMENGGVCLTLNAAIVDISTNVMMWNKNVSMQKLVQ